MQKEKYMNILKAIDQRIRLKATGNRKIFARTLGVSKATLQRHLELLKGYDAPIAYDWSRETYYYTKPVKLNLTIEFVELGSSTTEEIAGGQLLGDITFLTNIFSVGSKNEPSPHYFSKVG